MGGDAIMHILWSKIQQPVYGFLSCEKRKTFSLTIPQLDGIFV
jgi:hypothetical protein